MGPLDRRVRCRRTGTEAASLLPFHPRPLDRAGVADFVAWGFTTGTRTLLADVERVITPWELPSPAGPATADSLWEQLRAVVAAHGDAWAALSGGLDSRAIAAAAAGPVATFGEADCADLPVAARVAAALDRPHTVTTLPGDAARLHEDRVFTASGGWGGPGAAPGAHTDTLWAAPTLLSGMSGDVVWGDTALGGRTPDSRLRKLGVTAVGDPADAVPPPPPWAHPDSHGAWLSLWTRQARVTWNGVLSRRPHTPVVPVCWEPRLLGLCLTMTAEQRSDRRLVRAMLARHAPTLHGIPTVRGRTYDLDRAFATDPWWSAELRRMAEAAGLWAEMGLNPRGVARILRLQARGRRRRGALVSRLRVLWRHAQLQGGWS